MHGELVPLTGRAQILPLRLQVGLVDAEKRCRWLALLPEGVRALVLRRLFVDPGVRSHMLGIHGLRCGHDLRPWHLGQVSVGTCGHFALLIALLSDRCHLYRGSDLLDASAHRHVSRIHGSRRVQDGLARSA